MVLAQMLEAKHLFPKAYIYFAFIGILLNLFSSGRCHCEERASFPHHDLVGCFSGTAFLEQLFMEVRIVIQPPV